VLVGGQSRRMGRDKAWIDIDGRPQALVAVTALLEAGARSVAVVGADRDQERFARAFDDAADRSGSKPAAFFLDDLYPGEGPLGGVVTALDHFTDHPVVVLSCDLPRVRPRAVTALVQGLELGRPVGSVRAAPSVSSLERVDVAMAVVDRRRQPLAAAYGPRARAVLIDRFTAGERRLLVAMAGLVVAEIEPPDDLELTDADDPESLDRLLGGRPTPR